MIDGIIVQYKPSRDWSAQLSSKDIVSGDSQRTNGFYKINESFFDDTFVCNLIFQWTWNGGSAMHRYIHKVHIYK